MWLDLLRQRRVSNNRQTTQLRSGVIVSILLTGFLSTFPVLAQETGAPEGIFTSKGTAHDGKQFTEAVLMDHTRRRTITTPNSINVPQPEGTHNLRASSAYSGYPSDSSAGNRRLAIVTPELSTPINSGNTVQFALPAVRVPTLFTGDYGYTVNVPDGASRLEIDMAASTPNINLHLFVRYGQDVDLDAGGYVLTDFSSNNQGGAQNVVITSASGLRAGVYHIGFGLFTTNVAANGALKADTGTLPCDATVLNKSVVASCGYDADSVYRRLWLPDCRSPGCDTSRYPVCRRIVERERAPVCSRRVGCGS